MYGAGDVPETWTTPSLSALFAGDVRKNGTSPALDHAARRNCGNSEGHGVLCAIAARKGAVLAQNTTAFAVRVGRKAVFPQLRPAGRGRRQTWDIASCVKFPYRSMSGTGTGISGVFLLVWVPSMDLYEHSGFSRGSLSDQLNQDEAIVSTASRFLVK